MIQYRPIFGFSVLLAAIILSACAVTPPVQSASAASGPARFGYAAQLYTVRHDFEADFEATLRRVAKLGYREIELVGLFDAKPEDVRSLADHLGFRIIGSHGHWQRFRDDSDGLIAETRALGSQYLILGWLPPEERQTLTQWRSWISIINDVAEKAHRQGIRFAYHNHEFEFEAIDGVEPFDLLLQHVDRRYVRFELDLYWLTVAGRSANPYFQAFPGGFPLIHAKDMARGSQAMAAAGDGRIDFPAILAQAELAGIRHLISEHDHSSRPYDTLKRSLIYLRSIGDAKNLPLRRDP